MDGGNFECQRAVQVGSDWQCRTYVMGAIFFKLSVGQGCT